MTYKTFSAVSKTFRRRTSTHAWLLPYHVSRSQKFSSPNNHDQNYFR